MSHHLDVTHAFDDATFVVDVHGAKTHDLERVGRACLLPASPFGLRADLVTAECRVQGSPRRGTPKGNHGIRSRRGIRHAVGPGHGGRRYHRAHRASRAPCRREARRPERESRRAPECARDLAPGSKLTRRPCGFEQVGPSSRQACPTWTSMWCFRVPASMTSVSSAQCCRRACPSRSPVVALPCPLGCSCSLSAERASGAATIAADRVGARYGLAIVEGRLVAHVALRRWGLVDHALELGPSDVVSARCFGPGEPSRAAGRGILSACRR